jgi:hypothetical protein
MLLLQTCATIASKPQSYPTIIVALVFTLSLVLILNIIIFVVTLSDHDIRIASFSGADGFHVSWDRPLPLWTGPPSHRTYQFEIVRE